MKPIKLYNTIAIVAMLLTFFSCTDVLDKRNLEAVGEEMWDDPTQAELYINKLYEDNMPDISLATNSPMSDETVSQQESYTQFMYGWVTANQTNTQTLMKVGKYNLIRLINLGIEEIEASSIIDSIKGQLIGQALFLRAYRHWEMVQLYGGIPLLLNVPDPYYDELDIPRSTTLESVNSIVADLDEAIASLPVEWPLDADNGRITSGAAAAFKGRVLLHFASPMFNPENKMERWNEAYDASAQAVELLSQMDVPRDLYPVFDEVFTTDILSNPEAVIFKRYDASISTDYASGWEGSVRPPSGGGSGGNTPTWELVKAFPMANGKLINMDDSGYDSTKFWMNRDPRFYATVAYNGCDWSMTGKEMSTQWCYQYNVHENNKLPGTGFFCRKATDPTITTDYVSLTSTSWHELRYAEVLMNLAECANEFGKSDEAIELVRRIRARAGIEENGGTYGIDDGTSQDVLRQIIMVERQVEFAYENKRYWDLRRRKMFREDLGEYVKKINGTQRHGFLIKAKSPWNRRIRDTSSPYNTWMRIDTAVYLGYVNVDTDNDTYFTYTYEVKESYLNDVQQSIDYKALYDYFAIPDPITRTSPAVEQTIGWTNGTFDPLAE